MQNCLYDKSKSVKGDSRMRLSFISTLDGLDTARLILAGEGCEPRGIASLLITGFMFHWVNLTSG